MAKKETSDSILDALSSACDDMTAKKSKKSKAAKTEATVVRQKKADTADTIAINPVKVPAISLATSIGVVGTKIMGEINFPVSITNQPINVLSSKSADVIATFESVEECVKRFSALTGRNLKVRSVLDCALGITKSHLGYKFEFANKLDPETIKDNPYLQYRYCVVEVSDLRLAAYDTATVLNVYQVSRILNVTPKFVHTAAIHIEDNEFSARHIIKGTAKEYFVMFACKDPLITDKKIMYKWAKLHENRRTLFPRLGELVFASLGDACRFVNDAIADADECTPMVTMDTLNSACYHSSNFLGVKCVYESCIDYINRDTDLSEHDRVKATLSKGFKKAVSHLEIDEAFAMRDFIDAFIDARDD